MILRSGFLFLCLVVCFLSNGCGGNKLESLKQQEKELSHTLDSLNSLFTKADEELNNIPVISKATVEAGDGLFQVLVRMGIPELERRQIVLALQDSVEFSGMRVGQEFYVAQNPNADPGKQVKAFRYAANPATIHLIFRDDQTGDFSYQLVNKPLTRRHSIFQGNLEAGSTLNKMLFQVGIPGRMVGVVSGVLQCKVAFQQAQPGDRFRILLEETFYQDSIWISGKVLYAEFEGRTLGHHEAFRYDDGDPKSSYNAHYTENGEALVFDGLRYPLDRLHITSTFGNRIHPITGQRRAHQGVDYGSPRGAPVYAVAEGVVVTSGYDQYSGNKIAVRHRDNSTSWYLHLDSRGVSKGITVNARQMIGKVGNTGRSTGPHLHFGFTNAKGKWINPLSKTMIATPKLQGERLAKLQKQVGEVRNHLQLAEAETPQLANDSMDVKVKMRFLEP